MAELGEGYEKSGGDSEIEEDMREWAKRRSEDEKRGKFEKEFPTCQGIQTKEPSLERSRKEVRR